MEKFEIKEDCESINSINLITVWNVKPPLKHIERRAQQQTATGTPSHLFPQKNLESLKKENKKKTPKHYQLKKCYFITRLLKHTTWKGEGKKIFKFHIKITSKPVSLEKKTV